MPSRAELPGGRRARGGIEWALRIALIVALVLAMEEALTTMSQRPSLRTSGGEKAVRTALRDWSTVAVPAKVRLRFDSTPSAMVRDWTAALPGAGSAISWESSLDEIGISVEPIPDPKSTSRIWMAAPSGSRIALADSLGPMDSAVVRNIGSSASPVSVRGDVHATLRGTTATSSLGDSLVIRPVLILGRAGWEGKFLAASLEEYGWKVDARLFVSPGNEVVQGSPAAIDTSRYAAVVVLDSSALRYAAAIEQYVRRGGGLIAVGEGASLRALRAILPGETGNELPSDVFTATNARAALALRPLINLKPDAIPLEKRGNRIAIAARRIGKGRVIQLGYADAWRWRMEGRGDPVEDYRNWWSGVVSGAAYAPRIVRDSVRATDAAPVATLVSALGPASTRDIRPGVGDGSRWMAFLFIVAVMALLVETASRRVDGKP
jgi:hypothetical protein